MRWPAPRSTKPWLRRMGHIIACSCRGIVRLHDTPHRIALGVAIGVFVCWLPLVGVQMAISVGVCWLLRGNLLASIPPIWISNPLTLVPMYTTINRVGATFVGEAIGPKRLVKMISEVTKSSPWDGVALLVNEFSAAFIAMCMGGVIVGLVCAIPSYFLMRPLVYRFQLLRASRRASWTRMHEPVEVPDVDTDAGCPPAHPCPPRQPDERSNAITANQGP